MQRGAYKRNIHRASPLRDCGTTLVCKLLSYDVFMIPSLRYFGKMPVSWNFLPPRTVLMWIAWYRNWNARVSVTSLLVHLTMRSVHSKGLPVASILCVYIRYKSEDVCVNKIQRSVSWNLRWVHMKTGFIWNFWNLAPPGACLFTCSVLYLSEMIGSHRLSAVYHLHSQIVSNYIL